MATTATLTFSNEKKTGAFEYKDATYTINGNATAGLTDNMLQQASGEIRTSDSYLGRFDAFKQGEKMSVNISNVAAENLAAASTVVTACLAKIASYYA